MKQRASDVADRVARLLDWTPQQWRPVSGGYTPAARFIARAGERGSVFVKVATTQFTAQMLRREAAAYRAIAAGFVPRTIAWEDHPTAPILIIEDLSDHHWPPPWDREQIAAAVEAMDGLHRLPADLPPFTEVHGQEFNGWKRVAGNPAPFLALGVASEAWLRRSLPALVEAAANCPLDGETTTHFDLRSDNICLGRAGVKFVDWSGACLGNPALDLGGWLPSLQFEGGPPPEEIIGHAPEVAAVVSGYFAANAGQPDIHDAPFVRRVQREQLSTALPWVTRALGLAPAG
jgi:thiamine kinase-like enzyme